MNKKNLAKRIFFALWAVPVGILITQSQVDLFAVLPAGISRHFIPVTPMALTAMMICILAVHEYIHMLSQKFRQNKFFLFYLWLIPAVINLLLRTPVFSTMEIILAAIIPISVEAALFDKVDKKWARASLSFTGLIILYIVGQQLLLYEGAAFQSLWKDSDVFPRVGIIITLAAVFICDSAAFFAGNFFGRHKLSEISPKKTIEGSIGGLLAAMAVMLAGMHFYGTGEASFWLAAVLGLTIGITGQIGDLTASVVKRFFSVKDSSNLIPGHGGILDRFDSLFFVTPFVHIIIRIYLQ
jgi:phosphatidate cytidylyltransferase